MSDNRKWSQFVDGIMSDDRKWSQFTVVWMAATMLFALLFVGMTVHHDDAKYALGTSVSTTAEYNNTFNDSFSGHIIAKSWEGITIRNENGDDRRLSRRWIKVGGA